MSFRFKTILGIALIESVLLTFLIWNSLDFLRSSNEDQLIERAMTTATLFATTSQDAVLSTDLASLESFVHEVLKNPGLVYARVLGNEGILAEGGDKAALERPFVADERLDHIRDGVFDVFASIRIEGMEFGRVELGISTDRIESVMADARQRTIAIASAEIALTALFSLMLGIYLTRQLQDLREASELLATGKLGHLLTVRGKDELAQTALAFNEMSSKLQQNEKELVDAKEEAERSSRAKSEFLSRMSHELRTPMNAILGFAQLMETDPDQPLTEDQADSVKEILKAGNHLLDLINEILDLSRIESGKFSISIEPVEVFDVVDEAIALVKGVAHEKQIQLLNHKPQKPLYISADRVRLKQVLLNLLSNAIKYNRKNGTVELKVDTMDQSRVRFSVVDTGVGLTQEQIDTIFEPFVRFSDNYDSQGTGIGLSITKRLVELMNGTMGLDSEPGVGSRFWFELPYDSNRSIDQFAEIDPLESQNEFEEKVGQVLYVEDNPANLRFMDRLFRYYWPRIELISAPSAELGLDLARTYQPRLILMDINLPGMDGFEALNLLREDCTSYEPPVVAVSANATERDIKKGKQAGFSEYVTKPIQVEFFKKVINHYVRDGADPNHNPQPAVLSIRETSVGDEKQIFEVIHAAFDSDIEANLVKELLLDSTAQPVLSLLAFEDDRPVGHLLFTHARLEGNKLLSVMLLAPLAVVPDRQKAGVGSQLIAEGFLRLAKQGVDLIFVLGYPEYYARHGFQPALPLGYSAPFPILEEHIDAWMVKVINPQITNQHSGRVLCADPLNKEAYWRE